LVLWECCTFAAEIIQNREMKYTNILLNTIIIIRLPDVVGSDEACM